ncbi:MAG TPA: hypothetical protein PK122_05150 [Candidatus Paceibacterota bacterium]|nr:hypothetical protein [Candidatus Paceibacterota bacterium]
MKKSDIILQEVYLEDEVQQKIEDIEYELGFWDWAQRNLSGFYEKTSSLSRYHFISTRYAGPMDAVARGIFNDLQKMIVSLSKEKNLKFEKFELADDVYEEWYEHLTDPLLSEVIDPIPVYAKWIGLSTGLNAQSHAVFEINLSIRERSKKIRKTDRYKEFIGEAEKCEARLKEALSKPAKDKY